jgi:hypothetical protein
MYRIKGCRTRSKYFLHASWFTLVYFCFYVLHPLHRVPCAVSFKCRVDKARTHARAHTHTSIYTFAHTYTCTLTYTHTHTGTHSHAHTNTLAHTFSLTHHTHTHSHTLTTHYGCAMTGNVSLESIKTTELMQVTYGIMHQRHDLIRCIYQTRLYMCYQQHSSGVGFRPSSSPFPLWLFASSDE